MLSLGAAEAFKTPDLWTSQSSRARKGGIGTSFHGYGFDSLLREYSLNEVICAPRGGKSQGRAIFFMALMFVSQALFGPALDQYISGQEH
jgi:hypothetical protein